MNTNTQKIYAHVVNNCLTAENRNLDGSYNFNWIDGDLHCDVLDQNLDIDLSNWDDIDAAYDAVIATGIRCDNTQK
jgi:hypothetical protein